MCTPRKERLVAVAVASLTALIDEVGIEEALATALAPFDCPEARKAFGDLTMDDLLGVDLACFDELL